MNRPPYTWQADAWQRLRRRQQDGRLMQALLITGQPGVGKYAFARELARTGLCLDSSDNSCGQCRSCLQFEAGAHPDLVEVAPLEGKRDILIDQIRDFCRQIQLTPGQNQGRYAIIRGADRLNLAAANALLKSLEEPPSRVVLILTADQLVRIPATIRSRCTRIPIPMPDQEQSRIWLQQQGVDAPPSLWQRRQGPCIWMQEGAAPAQQQALERQWAQLLEQLERQGDSLAAAAAIGEDQFDAFVLWWQNHLLDQMKRDTGRAAMRRVWDALLTVRREGHLNFNRLLALEGLFILYLQVAGHLRKGHAT